MGDSYNDKPPRDVTLADVLGIATFTVLGLVCVYILVMFIIHLVGGRAPV